MRFVKVKYGKGSLGKNDGCEKAPDSLLEQPFGKALAETVGEVQVDNSNVDETMRNISGVNGDFFVGGDHSITYGSFKGFAKEFNNAGLIVFDAHPDCYPEDLVNHENWVYHLIKEGVLKKENVVFVGLRAVDPKEREFLFDNKIRYFNMDGVFRNEENVCDSVMELAREFDGLYLSVDIDVLDPAFAPGTGYLEVGGMDLNQLIYFLKRIKNMKNLKRIDLVEINPDKDVNDMTVNAGRKIIGVFR